MKTLFVLSRGAFVQFRNGLESRLTFIDRTSQKKSLSSFRVIMVPLIEKVEFFIRKINSSAKTLRKLITFLVEKN